MVTFLEGHADALIGMLGVLVGTLLGYWLHRDKPELILVEEEFRPLPEMFYPVPNLNGASKPVIQVKISLLNKGNAPAFIKEMEVFDGSPRKQNYIIAAHEKKEIEAYFHYFSEKSPKKGTLKIWVEGRWLPYKFVVQNYIGLHFLFEESSDRTYIASVKDMVTRLWKEYGF